jgi:heptaprenyl diphosphate synthase
MSTDIVSPVDGEELEIALGSLAADSPLRSSCDYIVANPGKRFRAAVLECAACYGDRPHDPLVMRSTVAIELFHVATLAHDDVIDRGELRRGRATIGAHSGNITAGLAGGWLFARSSELLAAVGADVTSRFAAATSAVCEGEMLEGRDLYDSHRSRDSYLKCIEAKTARLIAFSAWLGATVGGARAAIADRLERYGLAVGMSFQITDDILDLLADPVTTGKTKASDLRGGVYTLPTIHAIEADAGIRERLEAGVEEVDLDALVERVRATGAVEKSLAESAAWIDRALDALPLAAEPAPHERQLLSLARGIGARAEEMVHG